MRMLAAGWVPAAALLLACLAVRDSAARVGDELGLFTGQSDVGDVTPPGTGYYDPSTGVYTLTSAGANTWYHIDDFHFLWKKMSGDVALTADIRFPPHAYAHDPNPHRKGILMFRQTLDAGGVYAGISQHGSGMTALQYRRDRGANAQDIELNIDGPQTVRLEKRGDTVTLFLSMKGEPLHQVGASVSLALKEPFYVGLGAVSHDTATTDRVEFSHVKLEALAPLAATSSLVLYSTLQTIGTEDQYRRAIVIRTAASTVQSPNWSPDGKGIHVHEDGQIVRVPLLPNGEGGAPERVEVGNLVECSGNYGLSPDGKSLAVSCAESKGGLHQVHVLAAHGSGAPRKVTTGPVPSYFHAWSPDSKTIAFTRGRADKADIFTVAATGGPEQRLTSDTLNDGPDYTPDGKYIYFDSARSGSLQIWRMKPDGTAAEQVTDDDGLNHSPHVSPDGKMLAFLSQPSTHDRIGPACLKLMAFADGEIRTLVTFRGDRGSFSMYGWGDANHLAFVSYQMLPGEARP
jgi:hypothetical protein